MSVRWGFLGAGTIATAMLAPAVHAADGAVLYAVAARDAGRAASLRPSGPVYSAYDELLADADVDAVYVSLPNDMHVQWAVAALEAGKHVLCEKPLALTVAEVERIALAAASTGLVAVEALMYRWHPRTRLASARMRDGAIGQVRHVAAGFSFRGVAPDSYRLERARGGGVLYDLGCYPVSATLDAFGWADVVDVAARADRGASGVDMTTDLMLSFDDGDAEIHVSMDEPGRQWLVVTGDTGEIEFSEPAYTAWLASAAQLLVSDGHGTHRFNVEDTDAYRVMVVEVSAAIRGQPSYIVPLRESSAVAAVLDAAVASADAGGQAVRLR